MFLETAEICSASRLQANKNFSHIFELGGIAKHFRLAPRGNSEFCFPSTSMLSVEVLEETKLTVALHWKAFCIPLSKFGALSKGEQIVMVWRGEGVLPGGSWRGYCSMQYAIMYSLDSQSLAPLVLIRGNGMLGLQRRRFTFTLTRLSDWSALTSLPKRNRGKMFYFQKALRLGLYNFVRGFGWAYKRRGLLVISWELKQCWSIYHFHVLALKHYNNSNSGRRVYPEKLTGRYVDNQRGL